jgi:hypothetical protein
LEIDTRKGFIIPPWASSLGITTRIEPNKEEAEKVHYQLITAEGIHIYTDGAVATALFMAKTGLLRHMDGVADDAELILQQQKQQQLSRVSNPEGEAGRG